jgi:hypothetical protein
MAGYQILYWQDIPSQVKAWDDFDEVKVPLAQRFMEHIDAVAQKKGLTDTGSYLEQWNWSEEMEMEGDASDVAEQVKSRLEEEFKL